MPESMSNAVQIGVHSALTGNASLTALLAEKNRFPGTPAIYDTVPQPVRSGNNSNFPYIVMGDDDLNDWSTDTASGAEVMATVHVWSRAQNKRESKVILGEVYSSLHRQELTLPGHEFIGCDFTSEPPVVMDPDMETYHGTITFRIILDELGYGE